VAATTTFTVNLVHTLLYYTARFLAIITSCHGWKLWRTQV